VPTVLSPSESRFNPGSIALDASSVFFGSADTIKRVEKTADGLKTLAIGQSPFSMQVDADYIYWVSVNTSDVSRLPKAGGDVEKIATALEAPRWLELMGDQLYVGTEKTVLRMEKDGSAPLTLARAAATESFGPISVDASCVFVASGNAVRRVPR
jgi:hypothetical protein